MQICKFPFFYNNIPAKKEINRAQKAQSIVYKDSLCANSIPVNTLKAYSLRKINFSGSKEAVKLPKLYSIVFKTNSYLKKVHESVLNKCSKMGWTKDSPELAKWLHNRLEKEERFWWTTNLNPRTCGYETENGSVKATPEENCNYAQALAIYACATMERQIRRAILKVSASSKQEEHRKYGETLERLSNIYRAQYKLHRSKPYLLEIAHDLARLAGENYKPNENKPCYIQSNAHRVHLRVDKFDEKYIEKYRTSEQPHFKEAREDMPYIDEVLHLSLAFNQIGEGSHNIYAPHILKDLVSLYKVKDDVEKEKMYADYLKKVVPAMQEPELWFKKIMAQGRSRQG